MINLYKSFNKFTISHPIILCVTYFFISLILISNSSADSRFKIQDIFIEINSTNITNVRNEAIIKAQQKAYKKMIIPIIRPEDYSKIYAIENFELNTLVSGIELIEEIILEDKYKANFTINFSPKKVHNYFKRNEILYSTIESKPISLISIISFLPENNFTENTWYNAWKVQNKNLDIFNLEIVTRNDLNNPNISIEELMSLNIYDQLNINDTPNNILIWANFVNYDDTSKMDILVKTIFNKKNIIFTKKYISLSNEENKKFISRSVIDLRKTLFNMWIESTASSKMIETFKFRFIGKNLKDWNFIETKLLKIDSISNINIEFYEIESLSGTIYFSGNLDKLKLILSEHDILFTYLGDYSDISIIDR